MYAFVKIKRNLGKVILRYERLIQLNEFDN